MTALDDSPAHVEAPPKVPAVAKLVANPWFEPAAVVVVLAIGLIVFIRRESSGSG